MFKRYARKIRERSVRLEEVRPVLEFIARSYPKAWMLLADVEMDVGSDAEREAFCVRRYLEESEQEGDTVVAWKRLVSIYRKLGDVSGSCSAFLKVAEVESPDQYGVSNVANYINGSRDLIEQMDAMQRGVLLRPIAELMEGFVDSLSATDLSRLAWLYLHLGDVERADGFARMGLSRDVENVHCQRLVERTRR